MTEDQESLLQNTVDSLQQQVKLRRKIRAVALLWCLVGLPEGTEGSDTVVFLEKWLLEILGQESFTNLITTGRANPLYRTVETKHSQNSHYALEFKDKDKVLQIVWAKGKVTNKNAKDIFFYKILHEGTHLKRRKCYEVKQMLIKPWTSNMEQSFQRSCASCTQNEIAYLKAQMR